MTIAHPLLANRPLPLHISAGEDIGPDHQSLCAWATTQRDTIEGWLQDAGVVLLRGFEIGDAGAFRSACAAISQDLQNYTGGDSPRHNVTDQVYTSTEYPADSEVLLHNELSYAGWSPDRVFFCCLIPSETGGETHIADGRKIYTGLNPDVRERFAGKRSGLAMTHTGLNPDVRERFEQKGVTYLQHLWDEEGEPGLGKPWQETFETNSRSEAEVYLVHSGMTFEWADLGICTSAILAHPATGQMCWHNQADQWHRDIASVKDTVPGSPDAEKGANTAGVETLGNHVTFGDGSEIDVDDLMHVRDVSKACEVLFPWQAGDLMIIDNIMAMHGRKPFTGNRRVLVAMA